MPRKKKIMNNRGEGDFHYSAADHEAGGGFQQERYGGKGKSGSSGNPNNSYGNFYSEGRADAASWIKDGGKSSNSRMEKVSEMCGDSKEHNFMN